MVLKYHNDTMLMPSSKFTKHSLLFLKMLSIFVVITLCLTPVVSGTSQEKKLWAKWKKNPCWTIRYWGTNWKQLPFEERIKEAPPELLDKISFENEIEGFLERPEPLKPHPHIYNALRSIKTSLPEGILDILENQFIGVFSVKNLGGSGYTDVVYDREGNEKYALIVIDSNILLKRTANEWATWKVNSTFKSEADKNVEIRAVIEHEENDNTENALRFILLHELGHVLGATTRAHSSWVEWYIKKRINMKLPFTKLSWELSEDHKIESLFEDNFPERKRVQFYAFDKSRLTYKDAPIVYDNLMKHTNFPSLYASQNLWEDFSESFATYVHVVGDKRPWTIVIEKQDEIVLEVDSCWGQKRCKDKEIFMKGWMITPIE